MKCPFCQQELKYDAWNEVYWCRNPNCKHSLGFGTKELWQELIRTRKALEVAIDTLKYENKCIKGGCVNWETEIDRALDQIKQITETKE